MSAVAEDAFAVVLKKLGKRKRQPWQKRESGSCVWTDALGGDGWDKVHTVMLEAMDEMKGHGVRSPLAALQQLAFDEALKPGVPAHVHTAALWLTDTRLRVEAFRDDSDEDRERLLRLPLERRGILKPKAA